MSENLRVAPTLKKPRAKRLPVAVRRERIIEKAITMFAEHGFGANTRMLADDLGTTQPLIYRYFDSKDELIDAVIEQIHQRQTSVDWVVDLGKRTIALRDRLISFASRYSECVYDRAWIRTYMYAGLSGGEYNRRYISTVTEPILYAIAVEIRHEFCNDSRKGDPPGPVELELLWLFHGGLYYRAIRRHIYGLEVDEEMFRVVLSASVDALLQGIRDVLEVDPR